MKDTLLGDSRLVMPDVWIETQKQRTCSSRHYRNLQLVACEGSDCIE